MNTPRRGATAVEFALLLPVLLTLAAGIATYAWYFIVQASLVDAVTEGARRSASYVPPPSPTPLPFGQQMQATAKQTTIDACVRSGWEASAVTVKTELGTLGGLNTLTITADADVTTRFGGWLFPLPPTVSAEIQVATLDQP